jgi:nucleotide-binding universal stress UspA family protein
MKTKILLIISFLRSSPEIIKNAINIAARDKAELVVFFALDEQYAHRIADKLTHEGWIGHKPSEQLYQALLKEYRLQAEMKVEEIGKQAKKKDVKVRAIIRSGAILEETLNIARLEEPDLIIFTRRKRSKLSRLIFGSVAKKLKKEANCKVRVVDAK